MACDATHNEALLLESGASESDGFARRIHSKEEPDLLFQIFIEINLDDSFEVRFPEV